MKGDYIMKDNFSWIDNEFMYPYVDYSTAVIDAVDGLCIFKTINDCLSVKDNESVSNIHLISDLMHTVRPYLEKTIPNASHEDFSRIYNLIPSKEDISRILKSCYGLLMNLRNWVEHHGDITINNCSNIYEYSRTLSNGKNECFRIHLPFKALLLLDEILRTFSKDSCGVSTRNHYIDFLYSRYSILYNYIQNNGDYKSSKAEMFSIKHKTKLKWERRCLLKNPSYDIVGSQLVFNNIFDKKEGIDLLINYKESYFIIPYDILKNRGIDINSIEGWKLSSKHTHGVVL